jgi:hypothetical protein
MRLKTLAFVVAAAIGYAVLKVYMTEHWPFGARVGVSVIFWTTTLTVAAAFERRGRQRSH